MEMSQPNPALAEAYAAYRTGQLPRARQLGLELLSLQPNRVEVLHLLAMVAHGMGDMPLHVEYLHRLLAVAPNHAPSLNALANILRVRGRVEEAIDAAKHAIEAEPQYASAYNTLGLCYGQIGDYESAVDSFQNAIRLQPKVGPIHVNLAESLQQLGRLSEALGAYQQALELMPNSAEVFEGMGRVFSTLKKRPKAVECLERALELTPDSVKRILQVADAKAMYGQTAESLALVERALTIDPNSAPAHFFFGLRMQDVGEFEAAGTAFLKSIEIDPNQGEAYLGLATNARLTAGDSGLVGQIQRLIEANSVSDRDFVLLHTALGKAFDDLGAYEKAIGHIDEANRIETMGRNPFDQKEFERFVDRIIGLFTPAFFEERTSWVLDSELPLLIIGLPRSGTTLTEQILSSHPEVAAAGEQQFWSDADANESIIALGSNKHKSQELAVEYERLLRGFGPEARFVTDKRPDNFLFVGLIHALFANARFIHCRRELVHNALSLYMTPYRTRPPFAHSREDIVFYVHQYQRLMRHWTALLPKDRILDVDYETLVTDRVATTKLMLDFCGLDWDEACLRPEHNKRSVATPSNWQSRQAVYATSIERWRRYEPWLGALKSLLPPTV